MRNPTRETKKTQIEELIERMETTGTLPWVKAWKTTKYSGGVMPINHISGKLYRGGNRWSLMLQQLINGYSSNAWLTFNQARELGLQVIKGSKGTMITHYTTYIKVDKEDEEKSEHKKSLRTFTVFNLDQTNYIPTKVETEAEALIEQEQELAAVLRRYVRREGIYLGYGNPSYNMIADVISMPNIEEFIPREEYHSTLAHECVHSTGIAKRLNRYDTSYTHEKYSVEELVAELATIILCSEYGIDATIPNSEAYLQSWLKAIKQSPKFLTTVFGDAEKAVDYIKGIL
jgi:antirestriction protein ArdC